MRPIPAVGQHSEALRAEFAPRPDDDGPEATA
jgi:hypothetical protein